MGANEKHEATYHCGEYTPDVDRVRNSYIEGMAWISGGTAYESRAAFDRFIAKIKAEAKAEALEEAADEINRIDPAWGSALWIEPKSHYVPLPEWLRDRANQYKETPNA